MTSIHRIFPLTGASIAALLVASLGVARAEPVDIAPPDEARIAAEQLLGSDGEDRAFAALLPFTRRFDARGVIGPGLAEAAERAGAPASALIEPLQAMLARLDPASDLAPDDRFALSWEQTFNGDGRPIGLARVLSLDLATSAKGRVSMIRFRPFTGPVAGSERLFFADGTLAAPPPIRLPLDDIKVTSGFGLRPDPLDQPARRQPVEVQPAAPPPPPPPEAAAPPPLSAAAMGEVTRAYAGFGNGGQLGNVRDLTPGLHNNEIDRIMAERRLRRLEEEARRRADEQAEAGRQAARQAAAEKAAAARAANPSPSPPKPRLLYMHEGLDLLALPGTPVRAAADGRVVLARPDRGYGNAIHLEHGPGMLTLYAHLAGFAAGIEPGATVQRGEVIGFVGSTGRSTGAHLHFEFLLGGRPVDPSSGTVALKLGAADLVRLQRQLAIEDSLRNEPRKNDRAPIPLQDQVAKAE